jgi:hypothetical protein
MLLLLLLLHADWSTIRRFEGNRMSWIVERSIGGHSKATGRQILGYKVGGEGSGLNWQ